MDMLYQLPTIAPAVYYSTIATSIHLLDSSHPLPGKHKAAQKRPVAILEVVQGTDMPSRNDHYMHPRLRMDITESYDLGILVNDVAGNYPGDDFTKHAFIHIGQAPVNDEPKLHGLIGRLQCG